jgi:N-acetylglucosaminyldiphosphoundecaprenol N-acetyl-beta-D-mannosaminyltransferase
VLSWDEALGQIADWAMKGQSRYVCLCNAHSVVTGRTRRDFGRAIARADMVAADGAPVAWMMRKLGHRTQERLSGPDLMWNYLAQAAPRSESIYLYGGTPETLEALQTKLASAFPGVRIAGADSPPFRKLSPEEDAQAVDRINSSGATTVWISLGCPKQELWMAEHAGRVKAVMVGVGAAFNFHSGLIKRAPFWMQKASLEWMHRLLSDPLRLGKRYFVTNSLFIAGATWQLITHRGKSIDDLAREYGHNSVWADSIGEE